MLAFDLDRWEGGWQGRAGHDVLRADRVRRGIEVDEVAGPRVDRADAETCALGINTVEIDQSFERRLEAAGIVKARSLHGTGRIQPWHRKARREEGAYAFGQSGTRAHLVQPTPRGVTARAWPLTPVPTQTRRNAFPERAQLADTRFRRVASNQRPIDGADRDAGDPVGMKIGFGQCLIDSGLICTKRTTSLEEERDALERRMWPRPRSQIAG